MNQITLESLSQTALHYWNSGIRYGFVTSDNAAELLEIANAYTLQFDCKSDDLTPVCYALQVGSLRSLESLAFDHSDANVKQCASLVLARLKSLKPASYHFSDLLQELKERDLEPLASFAKGDYFKLGSQCHLVIKRSKSSLTTQTIGAKGEFASGATFAFADEYPKGAIRLSALDVYAAIRLIELDQIKPYNPLQGLNQAINAYLHAEREYTRI